MDVKPTSLQFLPMPSRSALQQTYLNHETVF